MNAPAENAPPPAPPDAEAFKRKKFCTPGGDCSDEKCIDYPPSPPRVRELCYKYICTRSDAPPPGSPNFIFLTTSFSRLSVLPEFFLPSCRVIHLARQQFTRHNSGTAKSTRETPCWPRNALLTQTEHGVAKGTIRYRVLVLQTIARAQVKRWLAALVKENVPPARLKPSKVLSRCCVLRRMSSCCCRRAFFGLAECGELPGRGLGVERLACD